MQGYSLRWRERNIKTLYFIIPMNTLDSRWWTQTLSLNKPIQLLYFKLQIQKIKCILK